MMRDTMQLFDLSAEVAGKQAGRRAEPCRQSLLELAREAVRAAARSRGDRLATMDDACLYLPAWGKKSSDLGSAAESIFNAAEWEFTGEWRPSRQKISKPRPVRVWRLRW